MAHNARGHDPRKIMTQAVPFTKAVAELEAIFGWHGGTMASHYTRDANRVRLAKEAMHKLANDERTSIPHLRGKLRAPERKNQ